MAITLTEKAAKHISRYMERRGKGIGLRLGVRTTGCSGLAYKLEYVDEQSSEDTVFESHGVRSSSTRRACPTSTAPNWTSRAKA
jgi:iron-sulfur cluster assembly protein